MNKKRMTSIVAWFALLVIVAVLVSFGSCAISTSRERAWRISCAGNLKNVGLGLKMWAGDHGEIYPERLADIGKYLGFQPALFRCFGSGNKPESFETADKWTDYIYVSGLPESVHPSTVLMYCPAQNHKGDGGNVLFADGHVSWFNTQKHCGEGQTSFEDVIGTISP